MKAIFIVLVLGLLLLGACAKAPAQQSQAALDVPADLENVDALDKDLDLAELDSLDQDLDFG